jgi:hypothetical protein
MAKQPADKESLSQKDDDAAREKADFERQMKLARRVMQKSWKILRELTG